MRTPLEQIWYDFLVENNIPFEEQVKVGPYTADFIVNNNIDIEVDGLQHKNKSHLRSDKRRNEYFYNNNYTVVRIPMNYGKLNSKKQQDRIAKQKEHVESIIKNNIFKNAVWSL